MSTSLTWQYLPDNLLEPLMVGAISLAEASELWDLMLQTPLGEWVQIPRRLHPAAHRIGLWRASAHPTIQ